MPAFVQCDGYAAYKTLADPARDNRVERIEIAFCWSHLRRRFVEIERAPLPRQARP